MKQVSLLDTQAIAIGAGILGNCSAHMLSSIKAENLADVGVSLASLSCADLTNVTMKNSDVRGADLEDSNL